MKRNIVLLIIVLLAIFIFVYPKPSGESGLGYVGIWKSGIINWEDKNCFCFGHKYDSNPMGMADAPAKYKCVGIPLACKCIRYEENTNNHNITSKIVTCN